MRFALALRYIPEANLRSSKNCKPSSRGRGGMPGPMKSEKTEEAPIWHKKLCDAYMRPRRLHKAQLPLTIRFVRSLHPFRRHLTTIRESNNRAPFNRPPIVVLLIGGHPHKGPQFMETATTVSHLDRAGRPLQSPPQNLKVLLSIPAQTTT